ncbi:MAG: translation elongation factor G, partial [Lachnospiraceae bacterium]|nr:translation elongation factor G [Lachnospiraceae bacterium]
VDPVRRAVKERRLFPCYFGSALKLTGVEGFLKGFETFTAGTGYSREFGARVFKISRDSQGNRLTHLKITGGSLKVKSFLDQEQTEKVNQIRIYSGEKFELASEAEAGCICVVTGPSDTRPGQGFGVERSGKSPLLEPVLTYQVILPDGADAHVMLKNLRLLEEEDPLLHIVWDETLGEIRAQVMGQVQMEILKSQILELFGVEVDFGTGNIVYKETIQRPVEGVGHFEPLRHYAEVHLLMEPLEPGSGLVLGCDCSEDLLDRNWQRLVLTHLEETKYRGTLTGSEITDMRITLTAGRAHIKHTEGGDFRQATYRAVRQGLKEAGCRLLEPYYEFILEVPEESVGRAMADIDRMYGKFQAPETGNGMAVLTGSAPAACMRDYQREVTNYTRGRGRLSLSLKGYEPCHNQDEVVEAMGYDFDGDLADPAGSVFCSHGAGVVVPWDQVKKHMHVQTPLDKRRAAGVDLPDRKEREDESSGAGVPEGRSGAGAGGGRSSAAGTGGGAGRLSASYYEDRELEEIFKRTYGEPKRSYPPGNALGRRTAGDRSTGGPGHRAGSGQSTDGPGQKTGGGRPRPSGADRADRKSSRGTGAADTGSGT